MRHRRDGRKLGVTASHRKAMLANMVTSLFQRERIQTTVPKAKEARRLAERLITFARRGDLAARRHVARTVHDPEILRKLFNDIAPRYVDRPGGYTRIVRLGSVRVGDSARRAFLELLKKDEEKRKRKKASRKTYHKIEMPAAPGEKPRRAEAPAEGAASAEAAEAAQAAAPAEGAAPAAPAEAPKAGAAPKKEKAHKAEAAKPHKAEGGKKAKAKEAEPKPKGKK